MSAKEGGALAAKCSCWSCCDGSAVGQEASEVAGATQQPHLPELEEVEVTERKQERWEECGGLELDPVLGSGAVVLVDAEWVVERAGSGGTLEPRQALPPTAFMPHSEVKAATPDEGLNLHVACISHCWLQANHPDPHGHNLRILSRALQLLSADGRWAVFMDFCCIHQNCRDCEGAPQRCTYQRLEGSECFEANAIGKFERERELFTDALGSLGSFYSHPATVVFMLTRFPDDYDNFAKYTRSGNIAPYFDRGWCFCESSWAMLTKPSWFLVDLGLATGDEVRFFGPDALSLVQTGSAGRKAPALPDAFEAELHSKVFTNGKDDRPRVAELYRSAFAQRFESAEWLYYMDLGWGDEEVRQMAAVLASVALPRLQSLDLSGNNVGDEGAAALAAALRAPGALPSLQKLDLRSNNVGDEGAAALAAALRAPGALPRLQELDLSHNRVGDEGAAALAAALRAPGALPRLQVLDLRSNRVGDEGAAALAAGLRALGALPSLQELHLGGNSVGAEGAAALAAALRAPGALPSLQELHLGGNSVGAEGAAALAAALRAPGALPSLQKLDLDGNNVGDEGAAALAAALRVLDLMFNHVGDEGAAALAAALRVLHLGGNNVGDEGAAALAAALRVLDLRSNRVGDEGAAALAAGLRVLHLGGNNVGDEGAAALAAALRVLDLRSNRVGDEGAAALAAALRAPGALPSLTALHLGGNNVGDEGAAALHAAWAEGGRPVDGRVKVAHNFFLRGLYL
ncbi:unnamed protein product [Prorocentrum cordatum]|uniref:Protein NLRC3 n=2 Tax=Prorocentrum cordatum TaxID=2364126 RepID=A0ABN9SU91_9DINO|nr:unnamed protein product [Polarella glacialis]